MNVWNAIATSEYEPHVLEFWSSCVYRQFVSQGSRKVFMHLPRDNVH